MRTRRGVLTLSTSTTSISRPLSPFYLLSKLESWISGSKHRRFMIVGDSAYASPPTAEHGVNQAFEDIYTLTGGGASLRVSTKKWHQGRQSRINLVIDLND
ncbi:unnamed protein product [Clonostachys solani]|uniref:Uncharacterized protein n=1 Tax=Clonostachys solani TaxID=160281 RepID=A0A9N9VYQ1_9HYPO|nr:unnamed protein product [Clonostachys solani]